MLGNEAFCTSRSAQYNIAFCIPSVPCEGTSIVFAKKGYAAVSSFGEFAHCDTGGSVVMSMIVFSLDHSVPHWNWIWNWNFPPTPKKIVTTCGTRTGTGSGTPRPPTKNKTKLLLLEFEI